MCPLLWPACHFLKEEVSNMQKRLVGFLERTGGLCQHFKALMKESSPFKD